MISATSRRGFSLASGTQKRAPRFVSVGVTTAVTRLFGPSALTKLRDILEEYNASNYHQGLPTSFMDGIIEETHESEDGLIPAKAAMRALENLKPLKTAPFLTQEDAWDLLHQELHVQHQEDFLSQEKFNALFFSNVSKHTSRSKTTAASKSSIANPDLISPSVHSHSAAMTKLRDILQECCSKNFHQGLPTDFMDAIIEETHEDGKVPVAAAMSALTKLESSKSPLTDDEAWDILKNELHVVNKTDDISREAFNALFYDNAKVAEDEYHASVSSKPAMSKLCDILEEYSAKNFHQGLPSAFIADIDEEMPEANGDGMVPADAALRALTNLKTLNAPRLSKSDAWDILQHQLQVNTVNDLISLEQFFSLFYDNVKSGHQQ